MSRLLDSARLVGLALVLVPVVLGLGVFLFPNYDARPDFFASSYSSLPDAGVAFPLSLAVLVVASLLVGAVVIGLRRADSSNSDAMSVVSLALGAAGVGLFLAAVLLIPVVLWAFQVADGSLTISEGADMSQALASTAQTLILLVGLGGMVVGMTVLGVLSWRRGWASPVVFWTTITASVVALVGGFAVGLFWVALGVPAILWTAMIGGSLAVKGEYATSTHRHS